MRRKPITIKDCPVDLVAKMAGATPPDDFESDGATLAFDILFSVDARTCAVFHDFAYFLGNTREDRAEADRKLFRNLMESYAGRIRANLWWMAVRFWGWRHFRYANAAEKRADAVVSLFWLAVLAACVVFGGWWVWG